MSDGSMFMVCYNSVSILITFQLQFFFLKALNYITDR